MIVEKEVVDLLNESQRKAVQTTEGNLLILAGPGTGKTKTLVERACYLLEEKKVNPGEVTITTFTKKAARELISRLSQRLQGKEGVSVEKVNAGNFHQIAQQILDYGFDYLPYRSFYKQMDDAEQIAFIMDNFDELYNKGGLAYFFEPISSWKKFSQVRQVKNWYNHLREGFVDLQQKDEATLRARHALNFYQEKLIEHNLMDFSGILWHALLLLQNHEDVRDEFQKRCRYLMVDEYQDTNPIQERLIELLSARYGNLCVVGDDDQSLYRFRGATVQNLLTFEKRYKEAKRINLHINYRSDEKILHLANNYLDYPYRDLEAYQPNYDMQKIGDYRFQKDLKSARAKTQEGAVQVIAGEDYDSLHQQIIEAVLSLKEAGLAYQQMVILSFSVKSEPMKKLIRELRVRGVPVYAPREGAILSFTEVKRLLAHYVFFFRKELAEAAQDRGSYGENARRNLQSLDSLAKTRLDERQTVEAYLNELSEDGLDPVQIGQAFLRCQPFDSLVEGALSGKKDALLQLDHLATFLQLTSRFCQKKGMLRIYPQDFPAFAKDFFNDFIPFLETAQVEGDGNVELGPSDEDYLNILTIHQAKGLEFPVVFLMEPKQAGQFYGNSFEPMAQLTKNPSLGKGMPKKLAEDIDSARLYYTSFTRAKDLLYLCGIDKEVAFMNKQAGLSSVSPSKEDVRQEFKAINMTQPLFISPAASTRLDFQLNTAEKVLGSYAYTTDIQLYDKCPRKYFFMRQMGMPDRSSPQALYGTLVHRSIELFHGTVRRAMRKKQPIRLEKDWVEETVRGVAGGLKNLGADFSEDDLMGAVREVLAYLEGRAGDWMKEITGSEENVKYITEEAIFIGQLDLVLAKGDSIVDFKTGSKPKESSERMRNYRDQLLFYRRLLALDASDLETKKHILYFTGEAEDKEVEFTFTKSDLEEIESRSLAVVRRIEAKDFDERTEDLDYCKFCAMNVFCNS